MRIPGFRRGRALLLMLASAAPLAAQVPQTTPQAKPQTRPPAVQEALPSARQIVDRHVAAIGGRAAIMAHTSSHATGTISIPSAGLSGPLEVFAARPDKSLLKMSLGGLGDLQEGFDGTIGWSISAMTGPTLLQGKQLEQKRFDSDFYAELHAPERYESMTTVEKTTFEGRPCYKVRLVTRGGGEDFEFYDVETGLKAGSIATRETTMGSFTGTTVETDYRKFGNLLQPATVKQTVMGIQQVVTLESVEYDKVDPAVFEPPAPIKALVK